MFEAFVFAYFIEVDGGCALRTHAFPSGDEAELAVLPGACEVAAVAPADDAALVLLGTWQLAEVWRVADGEAVLLGDSFAGARQVAWSAEHQPMVLVADYDGPGDPFVTETWALHDDVWEQVETTTEPAATVRAVQGGPLWQARAVGASVDTWALETAPGFTIVEPTALYGPRLDVLLWGRVPAGKGELIVRYTQLGVPSPVGPVWWGKGRRWRKVDDRALLETPVSVQGAGRWRLVSYEGRSPLVFDAEKGKVVWRAPDDAVVAGAWARRGLEAGRRAGLRT